MARRLRSLALVVVLSVLAVAASGPRPTARAGEDPTPPQRVDVPKDRVGIDDGDSFALRWDAGIEVVRLLGIDAPETCHPEHDIPYAQPFGEEAAAFLRGAVAMATRLELLRSGQKDPYERTLGYLYADGKNLSVLLIEARLAIETVSHFGDNALPAPAAEVLGAAKRQGPVAFEEPYRYRARMRKVAAWLRGETPAPAKDD